MEMHDSRGMSVPGRSKVATFVLVASKNRPMVAISGDIVSRSRYEVVVRVDLPSDAVRSAVRAVAEDPEDRFAAIVTGEFNQVELNATLNTLRKMADFGDLGQVTVSLAAQELSRPYLSHEFSFGEIGSVDLNLSRVERMFLVVHPLLRPPKERVETAIRTRRSQSIFGRQREIEELRNLVDLSKIISVVGICGVGKSTLLSRFVIEVEDDFPDGSIQIDLSSISRPELIGPSLLKILGAPKLPEEDHLEALRAFFRHLRFLLILDNADHMIKDVGRTAAYLVDECLELQIMIGSQRATRLPNEARYRLEGLELPPENLERRIVEEFDAVALFVDRAQMIDSRFRLTDENCESVAKLCSRLDGIPLAIELAASKVGVFSPRQLLNRLDDRLLLLKDADSSRPGRHSSLGASIEWGYARLSSLAKILMRRLSIFGTSFTLEHSIEVVCDSEFRADDAYSAFEELVDSCFLVVTTRANGDPLFFFSETVRLFASNQLRDAGETKRFRERHRQWIVRLLSDAEAGLVGVNQAEWLARIDENYDDIRNVVERCLVGKGDPNLAFKLLFIVRNYFFLRNYLTEGLRLTCRVMDAPVSADHPDRARACNLASLYAWPLGDEEGAREYALMGIVAARRQGDLAGIARGRTSLAFQYEDKGDFEKAYHHFKWAAKAFRILGDEPNLMRVLANLFATESTTGRIADARHHCAEVGSFLPFSADPSLVAYYHQNAGHLDLVDQEPRSALHHIREAFEYFNRTQEVNAQATSLRNAANAFFQLGMPDISTRFVGAANQLSRSLQQRIVRDHANSLHELSTNLGAILSKEEYLSNIFLGSQQSPEDLILFIDEII